MKTKPEIMVTVLDPTPPVISPQITGTLGNNGWFRKRRHGQLERNPIPNPELHPPRDARQST